MMKKKTAEETLDRIAVVHADEDAKSIAVRCFRGFIGEMDRFANRGGVCPCEEIDPGYWRYDPMALKAIEEFADEFAPRLQAWADGNAEAASACPMSDPGQSPLDNLMGILEAHSEVAGKGSPWSRYIRMLCFEG